MKLPTFDKILRYKTAISHLSVWNFDYFSLTETLCACQYIFLNPQQIYLQVSKCLPSPVCCASLRLVFFPGWVSACWTAVILMLPFIPFLWNGFLFSQSYFHCLWFISLFCWSIILPKLPQERYERDKKFIPLSAFICPHTWLIVQVTSTNSWLPLWS